MRDYNREVLISKNNDALIKEDSKCITCGMCKRICTNDITVAKMFEVNPNIEPICINCGQCANICPTDAIHEIYQYLEIKNLLQNKGNKKIVISVAPAVRVALGELLGFPEGTNLESKIPTIIHKMGADFAFDITFGADLTIMEEAMELVERIKENKRLPQFTSCCPAWVKYCEIFYPQLLPNLSEAKSPIAMQSSIIKTYFANKINVKPEDIIHIVVAPCTAKKSEINRKELNVTKKDTDYLITTREFGLLIKEFNIDVNTLEDSKFDSPMQLGSSSGVIFGVTGGVCEAGLRTAYYYLTNKDLPNDKLVFQSIRGMQGIKEASIDINGRVVKVAVCNGINNAVALIDRLLKNEVHYDWIEVMNCPGGCISGGGQPKVKFPFIPRVRQNRMNALYKEDELMQVRLCHKNPEIVALYDEFLQKPGSPKAKEILHTSFSDKSYLIKAYKK